MPLTLVVERPDGLEYRRTAVADQGVGGYSLSVPISTAASTGTWRVRAFTDPKRPSVGETTFLVEDYVPDRLEFDLAAPAGRIVRGTPTKLTVDGRYLYGAPASNLDLEGEVIVQVAKERPGLAGYKFGTADEFVETVRQPLEDLPQTDDKGKASFDAAIEKMPQTTRPLEAQVIVRLAESGGRSVERKVTLPVVAAGDMIGVKPLFSGRSLGEGETASFDVAMFAPDSKMLAARGLRYELLKIEQRYQYYRRDGRWDYEPIKITRRVADGRLDVAAGQAGRISAPVQWGRYRLEVTSADPNGPVTSVGFDAGFYAEASADTPDLLEIALDKPEYKPGEAMTVAVTARTAGRVTINVMGDKLLHSVTQDVQAGTGRIRVDVGSNWGTGAYVVATLRRPLDARAQRMPGRAIGVQWFSVDRKAHTLAVNMNLPPLIRPNSKLRVPVKIDGLGWTDQARVVVAAVDVGILNLTNYKPPAPDDFYLGQRQLSGRGPRPLRAAHRRDAGHPRRDPHRRRRGRAAQRQPAVAGAARALFRHRQCQLRQRRDRVRHSGLRRHRPRHGGGLEQGQGRPRQRRRHGARSGRADRDLAALPADRRPRHHEPRSRQRRRTGRRLQRHHDRRGSGDDR